MQYPALRRCRWCLERVTSDGLTTDKGEDARDAGDCWRQVDAATVITSDGDVVNNQAATGNAVEDTAVGIERVTGDRLTTQILEVTGREVRRRAGRRDAGEVGKRTESCADCISCNRADRAQITSDCRITLDDQARDRAAGVVQVGA